MAEGSGWNVTGAGIANTPLNVEQVAPKNANGQHIVYGIDVGFSGTPAAAVLVQLVGPDVSPNVVYWEGYLAIAGTQHIEFSKGISIAARSQVLLAIGAGGSGVKASGNIHGITR